ncbi:MAG: MarR family transcriptional regulator [Clostridia bacterium]|nr:MarR family transcriptional regulator [Clostridia bacterium]
MEDRYQKLCMLQMQIGRMRHRIIDGRIQELGIHPSQHLMLVHLSRMGRILSQARLAEELNVSPALVARTLKNLEAGGYIERADSSTDGRRNEITITSLGEAVLRKGKCMVQGVDACSFEGFSTEELDQLQGLLKKMFDNIARLEQAEKEMKQN